MQIQTEEFELFREFREKLSNTELNNWHACLNNIVREKSIIPGVLGCAELGASRHFKVWYYYSAKLGRIYQIAGAWVRKGEPSELLLGRIDEGVKKIKNEEEQGHAR